MFNAFRGDRPDVTPAQLAAVLVAGVPAVATLLSAFGVADLSQEQQNALSDALTWCAILAGLLIGGDATLRTARNVAGARRDSAAYAAGALGSAPTAVATADDPEADDAEALAHVSDEVEFGEPASVNGHGPIDDPDAAAVEQ
jgi:hypothetical protein